MDDRTIVALLRAELAHDVDATAALLADIDPGVVLDGLLAWVTVFEAAEHGDPHVFARRLAWWRDHGAPACDLLAVEVLRTHAAGDGPALGGLLAAVVDRRGLAGELLAAFTRWEVHARGGDAASWDGVLAEWQAATTGR